MVTNTRRMDMTTKLNTLFHAGIVVALVAWVVYILNTVVYP